jgi:hypothetical protein
MTESGVPLAASIPDGAAPWLARLIGPNQRRTTIPSAPAFDRLEAAVDHGCAEAGLVA